MQGNLGMKKLVSLAFILVFFGGCTSEYDKTMKVVYDIKTRDKDKNPIFDGEVEPPIPNKTKNEETVLGIDSNKNGIRDDVDIWINRTARSSNERRAMREVAREEQKWLKVGINPTRKEVNEVAVALDYAAICLNFFTTIERERFNNIFDIILDLHSNTDLRIKAKKRNNQFSYNGGERNFNEEYKYCNIVIENLESEITRYNIKIQERRK